MMGANTITISMLQKTSHMHNTYKNSIKWDEVCSNTIKSKSCIQRWKCCCHIKIPSPIVVQRWPTRLAAFLFCLANKTRVICFCVNWPALQREREREREESKRTGPATVVWQNLLLSYFYSPTVSLYLIKTVLQLFSFPKTNVVYFIYKKTTVRPDSRGMCQVNYH